MLIGELLEGGSGELGIFNAAIAVGLLLGGLFVGSRSPGELVSGSPAALGFKALACV